MRGSSFGYLIKEGSKYVWINRLMSLASIGILTACMLLIGASVLLSVNMNSIVGHVENQNEFTVFMADGVGNDEIIGFDKELEKVANIADIRYLSADEVLEQQQEKLGDKFDALKPGDNPLPATYYIKVENLEKLGDTVKEIEAMEYVDSVSAPTEVASTLVSVRQVVIVMGLSIIVLLVAVSLMIIANTIKITVFNRRREISIMKYVGATDTFIKFPFMVEGLILGLISAVITYFILWGGYNYLITWVAENPSVWIQSIQSSIVPFDAIGMRLLAGFSIGGTGLGVIGSMVFVRNYLKV